VGKPCEDAQHLKVSLKTHPFEVFPEVSEVSGDRQR
jgi:hypothetical protein